MNRRVPRIYCSRSKVECANALMLKWIVDDVVYEMMGLTSK